MPTLNVDVLRDVSERAFVNSGVGDDVSLQVVRLLIQANLAGHDSHGVVRIPGYCQAVQSGRIDPNASIEVLDESPMSARLKGNGHFGQVVLSRGVEVALEKSAQAAIAMVSVYNYSHCGQLGAYAAMLAEEDRIGMLFLGKQRGAVVPTGGKKGRLYQNTLAIALPSDGPFPVVLDMATSVAPFGKILVKRARNEACPEGWLVDAEGNPSTDPFLDLSNGEGGLLPLGVPTAGHKGSGLTFVMGILATALSGSLDGGEGTLIMAINSELFGGGTDLLKQEVAACVSYLHETEVAEDIDQVLAPGERSFYETERRNRDGIFVESGTWEKIQELAS